MERCIDKLLNNFEDCGHIDIDKTISGLITDSLYEIKELKGEAFINSAIEFIEAIYNCDLRRRLL